VLVALTHLFQEAAAAADLLVSAFAAAVRCGRRATGELILHNTVVRLTNRFHTQIRLLWDTIYARAC
jgi:hypothetical protein